MSKWLKIVAVIALLLGGRAIYAQNGAVNGFCVKGATSAITSGLNSTNTLQGVVPKCLVTVYNTGTTTPSTIYSNATGTVSNNPFSATQTGQYTFFANSGSQYDIVLSNPLVPVPPNVFSSPVTLTGVSAGGGGGSGGAVSSVTGDSTISATPTTGAVQLHVLGTQPNQAGASFPNQFNFNFTTASTLVPTGTIAAGATSYTFASTVGFPNVGCGSWLNTTNDATCWTGNNTSTGVLSGITQIYGTTSQAHTSSDTFAGIVQSQAKGGSSTVAPVSVQFNNGWLEYGSSSPFAPVRFEPAAVFAGGLDSPYQGIFGIQVQIGQSNLPLIPRYYPQVEILSTSTSNADVIGYNGGSSLTQTFVLHGATGQGLLTGLGLTGLTNSTNPLCQPSGTITNIGCSGGGGGGNTTSTSLTNNVIPVANGTNSIVNSLLTDNGTTLSYAGTGGIAVTGSGSPGITLSGSPSGDYVKSDGTGYGLPITAVTAGTGLTGGGTSGTVTLGLTNTSTTVNGQTCALGSTCTIPTGTGTVTTSGTPTTNALPLFTGSTVIGNSHETEVGGTNFGTTLAFTAPQINGCYSQDGILYTGGSIDTMLQAAYATAVANPLLKYQVCLGGGKAYTMSNMFVEPEQAYGVSFWCAPGVTINMVGNNAGTPWDAMILKQNTVVGEFSLQGCKFDSTNGTYSTSTVINANHVLDLQYYRGVASGASNYIQNVQAVNGGKAVFSPITAWQVTSISPETITFTGTNTWQYGDQLMLKTFTGTTPFNGLRVIVQSSTGTTFVATPTGNAFNQAVGSGTESNAYAVKVNGEPGAIKLGETYSPAPLVTPTGGTPATTTYQYSCSYIGIPGISTGSSAGQLTTQAATFGISSSLTTGYTTLSGGAYNAINCGANNEVGGAATSINVYRVYNSAGLANGLIGTITGASGTLNDTGQTPSSTATGPSGRGAGATIDNLFVNYDPAIYNPYSSGISTPVFPPTDVHGTPGFYDSEMKYPFLKNGSQCPIYLEGGGVRVSGLHSFGTATNTTYFPSYNICEFGGDHYTDSYLDSPLVAFFLDEHANGYWSNNLPHMYQVPASSTYVYPQLTALGRFGNAYPTKYTQIGGDAANFGATPGINAYTWTGGLTSNTLHMEEIPGAAPAIYGAVALDGNVMAQWNTAGTGNIEFFDSAAIQTRLINTTTGATLGEFNTTTPGGSVRGQFENASFASGLTFGETGTAGQFGFCASTILTCSTDTLVLDPTHVNLQAQGTATSSANFGSVLLAFNNNYWNGTANTPCNWIGQTNTNSGTTPTVNLAWSNNCLSGVFQVPNFSVIGTMNIGSAGATSTDLAGDIMSATAFVGMLNVNASGSFNANTSKTTVNCSTSGTAVFAQPQTGGSDKRVKAYLTACVGTASYTYPTPFLQTPALVTMTQNAAAASVVTSLTSTAVGVTGATTTGFLLIEGW